jgi:hypothetical protein
MALLEELALPVHVADEPLREGDTVQGERIEQAGGAGEVAGRVGGEAAHQGPVFGQGPGVARLGRRDRFGVRGRGMGCGRAYDERAGRQEDRKGRPHWPSPYG